MAVCDVQEGHLCSQFLTQPGVTPFPWKTVGAQNCGHASLPLGLHGGRRLAVNSSDSGPLDSSA